LYFSHRLHAERTEPFVEGLALGVELDGRRPRRCGGHMGSISSNHMGSVCGDHMGRFCGNCMGRFCGDRIGRFCGNRMGSISGDRMGRLICYTETRSTR
jgi:hypothetical protein